MRLWIIPAAIALCITIARAGQPGDSAAGTAVFTSSGDLHTDLLSLSAAPLETLALQGSEQASRKSPYLAAALSAVLPGAGEFYTGSYVRSALFLAAEAALWTVTVVYNNKGDRKEAFYHQYADAHWSVVRYAEWINANIGTLNPDLIPADYTIAINPNTALPPWQRIDWAGLNRAENAIGGGFSHSLAPYGEQQYYEMIGKYLQFIHGWDQTDFDVPTFLNLVTPQLTYYAGERGKANDYYNIASTTTMLIVINHVLSSVDAVLSAHSYNEIHSEVSLKPMQTPAMVTYVPTLRVSVGF